MFIVPERIMYNRFDKYFLENKSTDLKQFGFQDGHLTDLANIEIDD